MTKFGQRLQPIPWLPDLLTFLGGILFAAQTWRYIHTQVSILDEGNYLVKGLMFVRGQLSLYQDYGPWSNHMPLSFLIPGYVLDWFGPTLGTARLFAFLVGLLMLVGIWLVARRWGGSWWGAFAVWGMALNPAVLKIYSTMTSQVLVACLLAWVLVLVLAEERALWQLLLGSALAGIILMTRENMAPLLPLLWLYLWWQFGFRRAFWSGLVMAAVVILGFALYWPGILRIWAAWLPVGALSFLKAYQAPVGTPLWDPQVDLMGRLLSFFSAFRYHFVALIGVIASVLLWPRRSNWRSENQRRASVFLVVLFGVLFLAHAWVTVGFNLDSNEAYSDSYCVFCFPVYLGFFSFLGILLIVIAAPSWRRILPIWLQFLIVPLVLLISTGVGYASFETFGEAWANAQVPRFRGGRILSESVPLWGYLDNYGGISFNQARRLIPTVVGFLWGLGILLVSGILRLKKVLGEASFGYVALVTLLIMGYLLAPTSFLGAGYQNYDCNSDVVASYAELGAYLKEQIPPGSLVYWQGGLSPAPLLYIPDVKVFAPQLNQDYTFHLSGDSEALRQYGFWNRDLAEEWLAETDYALVVTRYYKDWARDILDQTEKYELVGLAPPAELCEPEAVIRVFRRIP